MAELYNMIFVISFIGMIGLTAWKLYNLFHKATKHDFRISMMIFLGIGITYGISLIVTILGYTELLFIQLFSMQQIIFLLSVILFITEIFFAMTRLINGNKRDSAYNSKEARGYNER